MTALRRLVRPVHRWGIELLIRVNGAEREGAAESVRPLVRRVKRGFGRGDWTEGGGPHWVPRVTGIIIAAALGGAVMYFLDPENGPRRRQRVLSVKLRAKDAANEASEAVEEVGGPVSRVPDPCSSAVRRKKRSYDSTPSA